MRPLVGTLALLGAALMLSACDTDRPAADRSELRVVGGDPERGKRTYVQYGCGTCHTAPGVRGPQGKVGPPLTHFAERSYIGGQLPNRPDALVRFLQDPPALIPGTAMPDMGVNEQEARDIAAFLYTLD
ncbi:c-type cytochrome [Ectothiorhodospiraceae bacterium 2226]|nr:c-type cytochrome [Ectothiorhodospiraceae bacterium 2226]